MFTQTVAFSSKSIAFLQETLCSLKHLHSLTKALGSPKKLCVHSNICILLQKHWVPLRNFVFTQTVAFSSKSIAFLQETLCSLKHLHSLTKALGSPKKLCVHSNSCILFQKHCVPPRNFVFTQTFAFSYKSIGFP